MNEEQALTAWNNRPLEHYIEIAEAIVWAADNPETEDEE